MPVYSLVYTSRTTTPVTADSLAALLTASQEGNTEKGLTGVLVFALGCYVQELEGDEAAVETVFDKVRHDPRHTEVTVLGRERVAERTFRQWSMGLLRVNAQQLAASVPDLRQLPETPNVHSAYHAGDLDLFAHLDTAALARKLLRSGPPEIYPGKSATRRDWVPFEG